MLTFHSTYGGLTVPGWGRRPGVNLWRGRLGGGVCPGLRHCMQGSVSLAQQASNHICRLRPGPVVHPAPRYRPPASNIKQQRPAACARRSSDVSYHAFHPASRYDGCGHKPGLLGDFSVRGKLAEPPGNSVQPQRKNATNTVVLFRHSIFLCKSCWLGKQDHYDPRM